MISGAKKNIVLISICAGAMAAVLALLTQMALNAEKMEAQAAREGLFQEAVRQALWRMDSALTPILVQEAARPAEQYTAVYSDSRSVSYSKKGAPAAETQRVFSPLLGMKSEWIRLHFFVDLSVKMSSSAPTTLTTAACSPQVPATGPLTQEEVDEATNAFPEQVSSAKTHLQELQALLNEPQVRDRLGLSLARAIAEKKIAQGQAATTSPFQSLAPQQKSDAEYQSRQSNLSWALTNAQVNAQAGPVTNLEPVWVLPPLSKEPELFLLRTGEAKTLFQGIWLDWPRLRQWLCQGTNDLFPNASLRPTGPSDESARGRMLAAIPAVLEPGPWKGPDANSIPVIRWLIAGAWVVSIAAFVALFAALASATELSERRGRFVSAVTHELRTPLTTFQLYSQMLADGMVPAEKDRKEYLETLKHESERLARIVENVLLYARVEGKRAVQHRETISAADLVERIGPTLSKRAAEGGMTLEIDNAKAGMLSFDTDPQIVEQILLNLVDNSCKYAREAADRRLHLVLYAEGSQIAIDTFDHGPGIAPQDEAKLFQPFQRGAAFVASNVSGIGLGLSLARALAIDLGGDLSFVKSSQPGARFRLQLPAAAKSKSA